MLYAAALGIAALRNTVNRDRHGSASIVKNSGLETTANKPAAQAAKNILNEIFVKSIRPPIFQSIYLWQLEVD
jgi:hypothetical protein